MKTIWIIDHYSSEPKYGGISRQYDFARELSKRGYQTIIFSSAFSHYTHSYITDEEYMISEIAENAKYVYVHTVPYNTNGGIGRVKNMISFCKSVHKSYKRIAGQYGKPDVVMGCSVHPLAWIEAYKIAKKFNVKFIAEVRDLWPEVWLLSGMKKKYDPMVLFFGTIEKWAYKKADRIIYSMLYGDKYICDKLGIAKSKVTLIGQPMDCERFDKYAIEKKELVSKEILDFMGNSFVCVFTGYYMEYEGVYQMLEAAKITKERGYPIKYLFVGSGDEQNGMQKYVQDNDLQNVLVGGRISKEAIPVILRSADICLAHCSTKGHEQAYKYGISKNKVNEYMYSKGCVIYGRDDVNDPVASSGAGYVIKPYSSKEFADKIETIYNMNDKEREKFGKNGAKYVIENHRVDILVNKLLNVYELPEISE